MNTSMLAAAEADLFPASKDVCVQLLVADEDLVMTGVIIQASLLVGLSHFLHRFLSRFGQPSVISQMLAGIILGPSVLGSSKLMSYLLLPSEVTHTIMGTMAAVGQQLFMFLTGIETDIPYLTRSSRRATIVTFGGAAVSTAMAGILSPLVYWQFNAFGSFAAFTGVLMVLFSSTSAPLLIRVCTELKLSNSEAGRLAISVSLINDSAAMIFLAVVNVVARLLSHNAWKSGLLLFAAGVVMAVSLAMVRPLVRYLNRRNRLRQRIRLTEVACIVIYVCFVSTIVEFMGWSGSLSAFMLGLLFTREGGTARTLDKQLSYLVHNIALPLFFGSNAMQVNFSDVHGRVAWGLVTVVVFSAMSKVAGTVVAAQYLNMPLSEGLVLGFLLNIKGHIDIIVVGMALKQHVISPEAAMALLGRVVVNSLIAGPLSALVVRNERQGINYQAVGLEFQNPETELRLLTCVHSHGELPTLLNFIEIAAGTEKTPIAAYVMQLVELTNKTTTAMLYHQQEDHGVDDEDLGNEETGQINAAVEAFIRETGIALRQVTAVSPFTTMHEDVCHGAEDVGASLIMLPYHKSLRVDGMMVTVREGVRRVNGKVQAHAPCTVGILVDRGLGGATQVSATKSSNQLMVLFFAGADDREAVALGCRLAMHPSVSLTVIRFLPSPRGRDYETGVAVQSSKSEEVLMVVNEDDQESQADEAFLSSFYTRFVVSGMATYAVKMVESSADTVTLLREMEGMYSLFLVGRGRRNLSPLVRGLSEWVESPELGTVGDLLASSDFFVNGSVLVIQQHSLFNDSGSSTVHRNADESFSLSGR